MVLGLSDIGNKIKLNKRIHWYVKNLNGWGKIFALSYLDAWNPSIQISLIKNGCQNIIMNSYTAHTCAVKGRLLSFTKKWRITPSMLEGIETVLNALIDEEPVLGMSIYQDKEKVLNNYINYLSNKKITKNSYNTLLNINNYLKENKISDELNTKYKKAIEQNKYN